MKGNEEIKVFEEKIEIQNVKKNGSNIIMHSGEKYLMTKLAELVTKNGGDILEIGFGMHLSADAIQSNTNVTSHTIIEIHPIQYERALEWAELQKIKTTVILGDWIEILPLYNMKFDGVLHDTHLDPNIPKFLDYIVDNCKKGTIVGFFEYSKFDLRFNGYRVTLPKDEWESIPYKTNIHFKDNHYELKYTTFDGNNFYKENISNKLL